MAVSLGLATLGSFAALASAARIRSAKGAKRVGWVALTAIALGGGAIWSMHFVGTVAYHAYSDVTLDFSITVLSAAIAVGVAGVGVGVVAADPFNPGRLVGGGVFAGFGITAMHYTGMAALRTPGTIDYDLLLVVFSVAVAVVAATTAFWLAFHVGGTARVGVASLVMAATIGGVHYTGMAAMRLDYDPELRPVAGVDPFALATMTAFAS
nr:MHYT domain-containing protein [Micromonospora sp. DSM 115978]